jgi:hypothetical protein
VIMFVLVIMFVFFRHIVQIRIRNNRN